MDRKKSDSYDEIHAMLVEAMQDACANEESGDYELPNIVPGYVYNKYNAKISVSRFSRFSKVAAVFVIVLLGMNLFVLTSYSSEAYGDKGLLHRIFEGSRGIFTDQDESEIVGFDETGDVHIVTNYSEIDEAKLFWSDLRVPQYIPDEYTFKEVCVSQNISGMYKGEYIFKCDEKTIKINMFSIHESISNASTTKGVLIKCKDRIINMYRDKVHNYYVADIYMENVFICIYGDIDKREMQKIAMNL